MRRAFTLIEVIIAMGVMLVILTAAGSGLQKANRRQSLDQVTENVRQAFMQAKSYAQSGKKDCQACGATAACGTGDAPLDGWRVRINTSNYLIEGICGGAVFSTRQYNLPGFTLVPNGAVTFRPIGLGTDLTAPMDVAIYKASEPAEVESFRIETTGEVTGVTVTMSTPTPVAPTSTPTRTPTPGPTSTPTRTPTPTPGPTSTPTRTPTPAPPTATPTLAPNKLVNGGFESGVLTPWIFVAPAGSSGSVISSGAQEGTKLVQAAFVGGYVSSNTQLYQKDISLVASTAYTLKFWARSTTGNDLRVTLIEHDQDNTNYGLNAVVNLTSLWQELTYVFNTPADFDPVTAGNQTSVNDGRLRFSFNPYAVVGDTYYVDGVRLYQ